MLDNSSIIVKIGWALSHPLTFSKKRYKKAELVFGNICRSISKKDGMFVGFRRHYFKVGRSALKNIMISLKLADKNDCRFILDFASGYGRVLRYIKARFPDADITACELEKDAVDYCVRKFKVKGVYGNKDVNNIKIKGDFDLIWVGSLFTHLSKDKWGDTLEYLYNHLKKGGILVFTTHGRYPAELLKSGHNYGIRESEKVYNQYILNGFGYANYPDDDTYGISLSSPEWVIKQLRKYDKLRIIMFSERGWDNHQDVFACIKD